jgi:DNA-binding NarL/FixJ family response regulator
VERHEPSTAAVANGTLTPRERETLSMLAVGLTTSEAATVQALDHQVSSIHHGAGGTTRTEAAVLDLKAQGDLPEPGGSKRQPTGSG